MTASLPKPDLRARRVALIAFRHHAAKHGHRLGEWRDGLAVCEHCHLTASCDDAVAIPRRLGVFGQACKGASS